MGKTVVFNGKMGMRKFGSTAPPFGKVACAVKVCALFFKPFRSKLSKVLKSGASRKV